MSIQPIFVSSKEINISSYRTSLKTDFASGVGAITVYNITQFAINQILCIGEYGSQGSELIKTHAATAPTGNTITLATNLTKPHAKDTPVYIYSFDQLEFSHSTTLAGSKSILGALQTIDPSQELTKYEDTVNTGGFYFTRYKNSLTANFSDYSDGIPFSGLPDNTVGYAIDSAMDDLGAKFSDTLTFGKLLRDSKQMLRLVRGKLKAWSKYQEYDYEIGNATRGLNKFAVPTTLYDKNSNRSVLNVRVGALSPLVAVDREEFLALLNNGTQTTIATQPTIGDTSLVLADTANLDDSGAIDIYVSNTKYTVNYTTNTRETNTLSGISATGDGSIDYAFPVNSLVWQHAEENDPQYFNISDGYLYIWPLINSSQQGRNILIDYYTDIENIDSQMDVLSGTKFDMLIPYLKFKIRSVTENNGKEDLKDPSYSEFRELLQDAIKNDSGAEQEGFYPRGRAVRHTRDNSNHYIQ